MKINIYFVLKKGKFAIVFNFFNENFKNSQIFNYYPKSCAKD